MFRILGIIRVVEAAGTDGALEALQFGDLPQKGALLGIDASQNELVEGVGLAQEIFHDGGDDRLGRVVPFGFESARLINDFREAFEIVTDDGDMEGSGRDGIGYFRHGGGGGFLR